MTVTSDDLNISPVDGYTCSICEYMQNVQLLSCCDRVLAYVCKYIGKVDDQNFVVTKDNGDSGQLVNRYIHLYNAKVNTSKINEDEAREKDRDSKKPNGRAISHNEMVHGLSGYAKG